MALFLEIIPFFNGLVYTFWSLALFTLVGLSGRFIIFWSSSEDCALFIFIGFCCQPCPGTTEPPLLSFLDAYCIRGDCWIFAAWFHDAVTTADCRVSLVASECAMSFLATPVTLASGYIPGPWASNWRASENALCPWSAVNPAPRELLGPWSAVKLASGELPGIGPFSAVKPDSTSLGCLSCLAPPFSFDCRSCLSPSFASFLSRLETSSIVKKGSVMFKIWTKMILL